MLINTDTDITFTNAIEYYQNLNKCQSTDFETYIAWVTLSFISFIMLSLRKRFDDYETMGEVSSAIKNELLEITMVEELWHNIEIRY